MVCALNIVSAMNRRMLCQPVINNTEKNKTKQAGAGGWESHGKDGRWLHLVCGRGQHATPCQCLG